MSRRPAPLERRGAVDTALAVVGTFVIAATASWGVVEMRVSGVERLLEAQARAAAAEHAAIRSELQLLLEILK